MLCVIASIKCISDFVMKYIIFASTIFLLTVLFLEIFLRVYDKNCFSILPIYFEKEHSLLLKNDFFCVKYKGHPKSNYHTNNFGFRINISNDVKKKYLLIGDSQALGYGINIEEHFLFKILNKKKPNNLEIMAAPHNDLKSIIAFTNNNIINFKKYEKVYVMFNLGMDIDRYIFGWQKNWNISNTYFELQLSKLFRIYPYIKIIYLKFKKYHFTFRPAINPYLDFTNDSEVKIIFDTIVSEYIKFLKNNKVKDYEFILIAPAWYIDENQIKKFESYYSKYEYINLQKNYPYYKKNMQTHINFLREIFNEKQIKSIFIDKLSLHEEDLFQINNYHLSKIGHEDIANSF